MQWDCAAVVPEGNAGDDEEDCDKNDGCRYKTVQKAPWMRNGDDSQIFGQQDSRKKVNPPKYPTGSAWVRYQDGQQTFYGFLRFRDRHAALALWRFVSEGSEGPWAELPLREATTENHDCPTEQSKSGNAVGRIDFGNAGASKCFYREAKYDEGDG